MKKAGDEMIKERPKRRRIKERTLVVVEVHPQHSLDEIDELERLEVENAKSKGCEIIGIMISIFPRLEYPKGLIECYTIRDGKRHLDYLRTTIKNKN
jgi:hypothetical protein